MRDGKVIREGIVDFYDFHMAGAIGVKQKPYVIKSGDSFEVACYYDVEGDKNTTFGFGSRDEMCMTFQWYYPEIPSFGICGANVPFDSACNGTFYGESIGDEGDLQRVFGSELASCDSRLSSESVASSPAPRRVQFVLFTEWIVLLSAACAVLL